MQSWWTLTIHTVSCISHSAVKNAHFYLLLYCNNQITVADLCPNQSRLDPKSMTFCSHKRRLDSFFRSCFVLPSFVCFNPFLFANFFGITFFFFSCVWPKVKESAPLVTNFVQGTGGAPQKGETLSHADVMRLATWPTITSIINKEYVEV